MTLTNWQRPLTRATHTLQDEVARLFNAFETGWDLGPQTPSNARWLPAVDLYEKNDLVTVKAEIPGTKKEDIKISLQDGFLVLSGERKETRNPEDSDVARFQRAIRLPYPVDANAIKAAYTDGILSVELPKAEAAKPKQIKINVN